MYTSKFKLREDLSVEYKELTAEGLKKINAVFEPHLKNFWVPKVEAASPDAQGSKYFGSPWLAEGEEWPKIAGQHLDFILQLDVKSLPAEMSKLLGGEGLLQFFYNTEAKDWPDDISDLSLVRLVFPEKDKGAATEIPVHEGPDLGMDAICRYSRDEECLVIKDWEEKKEGPHMEDYWDEGSILYKEIGPKLDGILKENEFHEDDVPELCHQGDKLGGYPYWTQSNETPTHNGEKMIPFFQLDAGSFYDGLSLTAHAEQLFAGDGTGHLYVSASAPKAFKFYWATA